MFGDGGRLTGTTKTEYWRTNYRVVRDLSSGLFYFTNLEGEQRSKGYYGIERLGWERDPDTFVCAMHKEKTMGTEPWKEQHGTPIPSRFVIAPKKENEFAREIPYDFHEFWVDPDTGYPIARYGDEFYRLINPLDGTITDPANDFYRKGDKIVAETQSALLFANFHKIPANRKRVPVIPISRQDLSERGLQAD